MIETSSTTGLSLSSVTLTAVLDSIVFNEDGLVPTVSQQHNTGAILMLAWMNREAVSETLSTGRVCFWSRSRKRLWRKGETSGQKQFLVEMRLDCDGDALLLLVDQEGVACHTGRRSCFFRTASEGGWTTIGDVAISPSELYGEASNATHIDPTH